ncbi:MAG: DUF4113 domain-containing protein [Stenotrophomonas sp.]
MVHRLKHSGSHLRHEWPRRSGWLGRPTWEMRQHLLSPNFTTSVHEIPAAPC